LIKKLISIYYLGLFLILYNAILANPS